MSLLKSHIKILTPVILLLFILSCSREKTQNTTKENNSLTEEAIISYISQPEFVNKNFTRQVTGTEAELQVYDLDAKLLYFSINKLDFDNEKTLKNLTQNPGNVEFGYENTNNVLLGEYSLKGLNRYLFRFPKRDFIVDTTREVKISYPKAEYIINVKELSDFANNNSIYGGRIDTNTGGNIYMANHGAFVSKKNEPSLKRFTGKLIGNETNKEKIAQILLDFVTGNIKFSSFEAEGSYEILKRPNEVLMTGTADCSGLTILYASLLEQFDIEYRLLYYPGHICVGIEGSFPNSNNLVTTQESKQYFIAETTVNGFVIGKTFLQKDFLADEIKYIQKPGSDLIIIGQK